MLKFIILTNFGIFLQIFFIKLANDKLQHLFQEIIEMYCLI